MFYRIPCKFISADMESFRKNGIRSFFSVPFFLIIQFKGKRRRVNLQRRANFRGNSNEMIVIRFFFRFVFVKIALEHKLYAELNSLLVERRSVLSVPWIIITFPIRPRHNFNIRIVISNAHCAQAE